jgi:hypothetical protein
MKTKPEDIWSMLKEHVDSGERAKELLLKVWLDIGPYGHDKVSEETLREVNNYLNFDDSE